MKQTQYDVLIMGGGLAGMTLAIQLKKQAPQISILIIEKATYPVTEAAHKVGESSVEIGSHYFENILGLKKILEQELPKLGLRFFLLAVIIGTSLKEWNWVQVIFLQLKATNSTGDDLKMRW